MHSSIELDSLCFRHLIAIRQSRGSEAPLNSGSVSCSAARILRRYNGRRRVRQRRLPWLLEFRLVDRRAGARPCTDVKVKLASRRAYRSRCGQRAGQNRQQNARCPDGGSQLNRRHFTISSGSFGNAPALLIARRRVGRSFRHEGQKKQKPLPVDARGAINFSFHTFLERPARKWRSAKPGRPIRIKFFDHQSRKLGCRCRIDGWSAHGRPDALIGRRGL